MNIYVGNIDHSVTENDLREVFEAFGTVTSANMIMDKFSGRSKGFGFVEMANETEADSAIKGLNGKDLQGRAMTVNIAKPRTERPAHGSRY